MRKFKSAYDIIMNDTPILGSLNELNFDIEDFQRYMEKVVYESDMNSFIANETAKNILII